MQFINLETVFLVAITYVAASIFLIARGGGYQFSGPNDTGKLLSRVILSPMVELRRRGIFYIRDQIFCGLFLIPLAYLAVVMFYGLSYWLIPLLSVGWVLGGISGWGDTLLQMDKLKKFPVAFLRILQFAGAFLFPLVINFSEEKLFIGVTLAVVFAAIMPVVYHFSFKLDIGKVKLNYAEFISGAILFGLSIANI